MLTRRTSLELGVWNLDAAARALLASEAGTDPLERAIAGVRLAPDLPMARMALARALWLYGDSPIAAARTAFGALAAIPRHLEASLWFAGCLLFVLGLSLIAGGLWCITLIGGSFVCRTRLTISAISCPAPCRVSRGSPCSPPRCSFRSRWARALLGLCAARMALGVVYGDLRQRLVLFMAASIVVLGAFPVIRVAGNTLTSFSADPVSEAVFATAQGFTHPVDQLRIEAAAEDDPLAAQALALRARRSGNLEAADAHYQELLRRAPQDPVVVNNAANVRLDLGSMESALDALPALRRAEAGSGRAVQPLAGPRPRLPGR